MKASVAGMVALTLTFGGAAHAQNIVQRVAIHYVNDGSNQRPPGPFADPDSFAAALDSANVFLDRMGYGYRLQFAGDDDVFGATQFYDLTKSEFDGQLQQAAQLAPAQYHWRTDAHNVYGVASAFSGGAARIPSYVDPSAKVMQIVTGLSTYYWNQLVIHEIGHHNGLHHTFALNAPGFTAGCVDDCAADTRVSPEISCTVAFGCTVGGAEECCCPTKISLLAQKSITEGWTQLEYDDLRWNVMSYFGATDCTDAGVPVTFRNMRMSYDQSERWADATRRYHAGEVSGFTYFVNGGVTVQSPNGYSDKPYKTVAAGVAAAAAAGTTHIVNLRTGVYAENLTLSQPMTLRAHRGAATVGF